MTLVAKPDVKSERGRRHHGLRGVFQPGSSVTVGGGSRRPGRHRRRLAVLSITPVSASQGAQTIVVKTPGFTDYKILASSASPYKMVRAITVSPAFGPTDEVTPILVKGAGFESAAYGDHDGLSTTPSKSLRVYLSDGQQFKPGATATDPAVAVVPTVCGNLQIVSDTELTCDVPAATSAEVTAGAASKPFQVIVADNDWVGTATSVPAEDTDNDGIKDGTAHDAANNSVTSRSSIFVRADF